MKYFIKLIALASFFMAPIVFAAGSPFTIPEFDALQKEGKPVLVHVHASWCPTCKVQDPIIDELTHSSDLKNLKVLEVDFDSQKDIVRQFKATMQSTLIVFKGSKEVGRSVGDTKKVSIANLLRKTN
jgi:thiol-disulfide isomerase/thioredoxin